MVEINPVNISPGMKLPTGVAQQILLKNCPVESCLPLIKLSLGWCGALFIVKTLENLKLRYEFQSCKIATLLDVATAIINM